MGTTMTDDGQGFRRLERIYRAIWIAFPIYVAYQVWQVLTLPDRLAGLDPALASCMQHLPIVTSFSVAGMVVYWTAFAIEMGIYAALLVLGHRVLARCAGGRIFVPDLVGSLRAIALIITIMPVFDLVLQNALLGLLAALGDMPFYTPSFDFDVTIFGVGLLMLTVTAAMGRAVAMREDQDLTI
jgi:hypothetical protein